MRCLQGLRKDNLSITQRLAAARFTRTHHQSGPFLRFARTMCELTERGCSSGSKNVLCRFDHAPVLWGVHWIRNAFSLDGRTLNLFSLWTRRQNLSRHACSLFSFFLFAFLHLLSVGAAILNHISWRRASCWSSVETQTKRPWRWTVPCVPAVLDSVTQ